MGGCDKIIIGEPSSERMEHLYLKTTFENPKQPGYVLSFNPKTQVYIEKSPIGGMVHLYDTARTFFQLQSSS